MRAVEWEGFFNARDLGGLPTRDGGQTRYCAFVRSADVCFVTPGGWRAAYDAGIRTIVDLRNDDEVPAGVITPSGMLRRRVPLDDIDDGQFWTTVNQESRLDGTPLYYPPFLRQKASRCGAVITALAQAPAGGVLFHCAVGRDRTGLVTLLLLALADVDPLAIAADYELSARVLPPFLAAIGLAEEGPAIERIYADKGTTAGAAVLAALEGFAVEEYLLAAGVTASDLAALRQRLLAR